MRLYFLVTVSGLFLSGCTSVVYQRLSDGVPVSRGSAATFFPLVPNSSGASHCKEPTAAPLGPGGRAVALVYPGPPERQVTVTLDQDGVPTKYVDVRGDLSVSDDRAGDRTTIGLYLDQGYAVLSNHPKSGEAVVVEVPLDEVLTSDALGDPSDMMQHVLTVCGGAI